MITAENNQVDEKTRWSKLTDQRSRTIGRYSAPSDEQAMRPYPVRPSFLVGMAMVFGFGAPLSNRIIDRLTVRKTPQSVSGISESWRVVGEDFGAVLRSEDDSPPKGDGGSE